MNRREFLSIGTLGLVSVLGFEFKKELDYSSRDDLIVGDSMAMYCNWNRIRKVGHGGATLKEIKKYVEDDDGDKKVNNLYIFSGTADLIIPHNMTFNDYFKYSPEEVVELCSSPNRVSEFLEDYNNLVRSVKESYDYHRLKLISPFPIDAENWKFSTNYENIERLNEILGDIYGNSYISANTYFHDFQTKKIKDKSLFADVVHLNEKGYEELAKLLGRT